MRRSTTGARISLAAVAVAGVLAVGSVRAADAHRAEGRDDHRPSSNASTACPHRVVDASAPTTGPNTQSITVVVPRTVLVHLDRSGRITRATTNTGCAPRRADDVYVIRANGSVVAAPSSLVAHVRWVQQDTRSGVYVPIDD